MAATAAGPVQAQAADPHAGHLPTARVGEPLHRVRDKAPEQAENREHCTMMKDHGADPAKGASVAPNGDEPPGARPDPTPADETMTMARMKEHCMRATPADHDDQPRDHRQE